jgi:hypothetical protein
MQIKKTALRRQAQCVRILSQFPILVQDGSTRTTHRKKSKTTKIFLSAMTIIIRESKSGIVTLEFKPP